METWIRYEWAQVKVSMSAFEHDYLPIVDYYFLCWFILYRKWSWNKFLLRCNIVPITEVTLWNKIPHCWWVVSKILLMYFLKVQKDFPVQSVFGPSVLNFVVYVLANPFQVGFLFFVVVLVFNLFCFCSFLVQVILIDSCHSQLISICKTLFLMCALQMV